MGFLCVLDTTGWEGRPPLSGHLLHVSRRLMSVSLVCRTVQSCWGVLRGCVPLGRRGRTCGQARLRVLGGRPMRRTGAPCRLLKFACTRAGRAARVSAKCGRRVAVNCPAPAPKSGGVCCPTTPPWSSVRPRAPRVWLVPLPGPSRTRYVGEEGQVGWRPRVWHCPLSLLKAGRWGPGSAAPVRGMWEGVAGVVFVSDTVGC